MITDSLLFLEAKRDWTALTWLKEAAIETGSVAAISGGNPGVGTILAANATKKRVVWAIELHSAGAVMAIRHGATVKIGKQPCGVVPFVLKPGNFPWFTTAANEAIEVLNYGVNPVEFGGIIRYVEV